MSIVETTDAELATRGLLARTVVLPDRPRIDLFDIGGSDDALLWHSETLALVGCGAATRLLFPSGIDQPGVAATVGNALRAIPTKGIVDGPGCGPIAFSALPFDRNAAASFTIPAVTIGRDASGRGWLTTVAAPSEHLPPDVLLRQLAGRGRRHPIPPDGFSLTSQRPHVEWMNLVAGAVGAIREGRFGKVVLARRVEVTANRAFVVPDILRRLEALFPSCMVFSAGGFLGASPELLVSRRGRRVTSHPLAGTVARSGDPSVDEMLANRLLQSAKDREEHRYVVDGVATALARLCPRLQVPEVPSILPLRNVSHLGTRIEGELADSGTSALDVVCALHPTPAVAGHPTTAAVDYIAAVEGFDRHCYSGPVGWMDSRGDGEWAVAVRSAEVHGSTAHLFSGVGVVRESDPASELEETQFKLQALLAALVRP